MYGPNFLDLHLRKKIQSLHYNFAFEKKKINADDPSASYAGFSLYAAWKKMIQTSKNNAHMPI